MTAGSLWTGVSDADLAKELSQIEDDGSRAAVLDWIRQERFRLERDINLLAAALLAHGATAADVLAIPESVRGYDAAQAAVRGERP